MDQFIVSIYQYVYTIIVTMLSLPLLKGYNKSITNTSKRYNTLFFIAVFFAVFIGLRPVSGLYFQDMKGYANLLELFDNSTFFFNKDTDNLIFDNLIMWWASNSLGKTMFFLLISTIYFVAAYIGIKKLFPQHAMIAYLVFLGAFSTFSYGTNGIKAGAAASIFICALGYWKENKTTSRIISVALIAVSYGFHHSMQLPIAAFILALLIKKPKYFYGAWCIGVILSAFHVTYFQNLFGGFTDEQGAGYLLVNEEKSEVRIAFRPDFILYSAFPVIIGFYYEIKKSLTTKTYSFLIHLYTTLNTIWMLCMYAEFNNRIAYLSWFLYPVVIIYPYLYVDNSPKKYINFSKAAKYHLYFTLFMVFVYYGMFGLGR